MQNYTDNANENRNIFSFFEFKVRTCYFAKESKANWSIVFFIKIYLF